MVASKNQRMLVVSRIMEREAVSPPPSLSLQGVVGVEGPHSLLAMCVLAGRQAFDHDCYQKINTW